MLDKHIVPVLRPVLKKLAINVVSRGFSADQVTIAGFASGLLCFAAIAMGWYTAGLFLLLLNRLADGIDGELARLSKPSDAGAFLDITLDFFFYALLPLGFAIADPQTNALAAAVLITSFIGTGASFLAYSRFAEVRGVEHPDFSYKGLYYLDGLAEGTETVLFFCMMCLLPMWFVQLAWVFAAICVVTAINRVWFGYRTLRNNDRDLKTNR